MTKQLIRGSPYQSIPYYYSNRCGPWVDSNGNAWIAAWSAGSAYSCDVWTYESTDGGNTWGRVGVGSNSNYFGSPLALDCAFDPVNNVIYCLTYATSPTPICQIWTWTIGTGVWARFDTGTSPTFTGPVGGGSTYRYASLNRLSDGSFVAIFQGPGATNMGTTYDQVYYCPVSAAGVWGTPVVLYGLSGSSIHVDLIGATVGASNRIHVLMSNGVAGTTIYHRSLSGATLDTAATVGTRTTSGPLPGIAYDATLAKVIATGIGTNFVMRASSIANPTWTADANSPGSPTNVGAASFIYDSTGNTQYIFFGTATGLMMNTATGTGTTWGTAAQFETDTPMGGISQVGKVAAGIGVFYQTSTPNSYTDVYSLGPVAVAITASANAAAGATAPVVVPVSLAAMAGVASQAQATLTAPSPQYLSSPGVTVGAKTYDQVVLADNPRGYWPLNDPSLPSVSASAPAGLIGWYAADSLPLSDGAAVSSWPDGSSAAIGLVTGTGGTAPTFKANQVNYHPAVLFNGTSDFLQGTNPALTKQPLTVFAVFSSTSGNRLWGAQGIRLMQGGVTVIYAGTGFSGPTVSAGFHYGTFIVNGASSQVRIDGAVAASGDAGANTPSTTFAIGSEGDNAQWWGGDIAEVLMYNGVLSPTDIATVEAYLNSKYFTARSVQIADASGRGNTGMVDPTVGAVTFGAPGIGDGSTAVAFRANKGGAWALRFQDFQSNWPTDNNQVFGPGGANVTTISMEYWAKITPNGSYYYPYLSTVESYGGEAYRSRVAGSSGLDFSIVGNTQDAATPNGVDNRWHHVVGTFDGGAANTPSCLYLDGVLVATASGGFTAPETQQIYRVHALYDGSPPLLVTSFAKYALYDRVLTPAQVRTHFAAGSQYNAAVVADAPSLFWPMDESASVTSFRDLMGGSVAIVSQGSPGRVTGIGDGATAPEFSGTYGIAVFSSAITAPFSIEAWFNPDVVPQANTGAQTLNTRYPSENGFDLQIGSVNATTAHADIGSGTGWLSTSADLSGISPPVVAGGWHHVIYAIGPTGWTGYVDGVQRGSGTLSGTALLVDGNHNLVVASNATNTDWAGSVAKIAVYPFVLSAAQAQAHFQSLTAPPPQPAVGAQAATAATATVAIPPPVAFLAPSAQATTAASVAVTYPAKLTPTAQATTAGQLVATATARLAPSAAAVTQAQVVVTSAPSLTPVAQTVGQATSLVTAASRLTATAASASQATAVVTVATPMAIAASAGAASVATAAINAPAALAPSAIAATQAVGSVIPAVTLSPAAGAATQALVTLTAVTQLAASVGVAAQATVAISIPQVAQQLVPAAQATSAASILVTATTLLTVTAGAAFAATGVAVAATPLSPTAGAITQATAKLTAAVSLVAIPRVVTATDNFNGADGAIGGTWTTGFDSPMVIASQQAKGSVGGTWTESLQSGTYGNDQWSEVQITGQPIPADWIGASVRTQNNGQDLYRFIYFNNAGSYELRLGKRISGTATTLVTLSLGTTPLPLGTTVAISVQGSTLLLWVNGALANTTTDTSILGGGTPGIIAFGTTASVDNWRGGEITMARAQAVVLITSGGMALAPAATAQGQAQAQATATTWLAPVAAATSQATVALSVSTAVALSATAATAAAATVIPAVSLTPKAGVATLATAAISAPSLLALGAATSSQALAAIGVGGVPLAATATAATQAVVSLTAAPTLTATAQATTQAQGALTAAPALSAASAAVTQATGQLQAPARLSVAASATAQATATVVVVVQVAPAAQTTAAATLVLTTGTVTPALLTPYAQAATTATTALRAATGLTAAAGAAGQAQASLGTGSALVVVGAAAAAAVATVVVPVALTLTAAAISQTYALVVSQGTYLALIANASSAATATATVTVALTPDPVVAQTSAQAEVLTAPQIQPTAQTSTQASMVVGYTPWIAPAAAATAAAGIAVGYTPWLAVSAASATQALAVVFAPHAALLLLPLYADVSSNRTVVDVQAPTVYADVVSNRTAVDTLDPMTYAVAFSNRSDAVLVES
jgi:hypothetical protein